MLTSQVSKQTNDKRFHCEYHEGYGHSTRRCRQLQSTIETMTNQRSSVLMFEAPLFARVFGRCEHLHCEWLG
ncbi:hypothetical protein RJT34_03904 [Clitoria ternatea]|uniref:Uncharacterized protein n=1 Tax=Clitoria ternatea TaxID=43366 RepID=A0AAN9KLK8_CLITE